MCVCVCVCVCVCELTHSGSHYVYVVLCSAVVDDHLFKDEYLFYRFKNDDHSGKTFGRRVGIGSKKSKRSSSTLSTQSQPAGSEDDISVGRNSIASSESGDALAESREDE